MQSHLHEVTSRRMRRWPLRRFQLTIVRAYKHRQQQGGQEQQEPKTDAVVERAQAWGTANRRAARLPIFSIVA